MPKPVTLKKSARLLALLPALWLSACAARPLTIAAPPAEWAAPVEAPAVPPGEALCDGAACLSDRQIAALLDQMATALETANLRLLRLGDWIRSAAAGAPSSAGR